MQLTESAKGPIPDLPGELKPYPELADLKMFGRQQLLLLNRVVEST